MPPAKRYFKKLSDKKLKEKFREAILEIQQNSYIGKTKSGPLSGIWGYDIYYLGTNYEIAYRITENDVIVIIMAGTRENFWDELKRYLDS